MPATQAYVPTAVGGKPREVVQHAAGLSSALHSLDVHAPFAECCKTAAGEGLVCKTRTCAACHTLSRRWRLCAKHTTDKQVGVYCYERLGHSPDDILLYRPAVRSVAQVDAAAGKHKAQRGLADSR